MSARHITDQIDHFAMALGLRQQSSFLTGATITPIAMPGGDIAPGQVVIEQPAAPSPVAPQTLG